MTRIQAWATPGRGAPLAPFEYERPPLGALDVEIEITHCGICRSDIHLIDDDWGSSQYPLVPGHEIAGLVRDCGGAVTALAPGERVGVGWQSGACFECEWCLGAEEELCAHQRATCVGRPGGYGDRIVVDSRFAFPLPDTLEPIEAAPLLCGGATVFTPLLRFGVSARTRLGVIGIGGLGHLALQFGRALGAHVGAFSTSPDKREEAIELGADEFAVLTDAEAATAHARDFDLILATAPADLAWSAIIRMLRPRGTLVVLGAAPHPMQVPGGLLITGDRAITGMNIGSRSAIAAMLRFAAQRGVRARVERFALGDVNAALERVRRGQARYRVVLENG